MKYLKELLFLKCLKGIGRVAINKEYVDLIRFNNGPEGVLSALRQKGKPEAEIQTALKKAEELANKIEGESETQCITVFDDEYPVSLLDMGNRKPVVIYVKGNVQALYESGVSIVGTRTPSEWTEKVEKQLVKKILDMRETPIISGFALGCDRIAHEETIKENKATVAVLPGPISNPVPGENEDLIEGIIRTGGCLVSEYEPGTTVFKNMFIERDAIVAALSSAVVVMECGLKSGTMHTADFAKEYGRKIGCFLPEDKSRGNYEGNFHIVETGIGTGIRNTRELEMFFGKLHKIDLQEVL